MLSKHLIGPVTELVAVFFGLVSYGKLNKELRWLFYFVCFGFITDTSLNVLADVFNYTYNLSLLHLYVPIEFLLISIAYFYALNGFYKKKFLLFLIIVFELYCIINPIFLQEISGYTNTRSIGGLILILFTLMYFHKTVSEANVQRLSGEPMVWVNVAVLFYFAGNFFFNVLFTLLLEHSPEHMTLPIDVYATLNALFYITVAIGFWKAGKKVASGQ